MPAWAGGEVAAGGTLGASLTARGVPRRRGPALEGPAVPCEWPPAARGRGRAGEEPAWAGKSGAGGGGRARGCAVLSGAGSAMRLTQGMCSIAECAAPGGDGPAARPRLVKIAVVGGSGVGKTGEGGARRRRRREGKGGRGAWLTPVCACPQRSWCGS